MNIPVKAHKRDVHGVVPVIPMPFHASEEIDKEALCRLVDFAVASGVTAICLPAYGSEFYKLSDEERLSVVRLAVEQAAGRILVMAQSNHGSSRVALRIARANIEAGADIVSIAVPRQFALTDDDLLRYLVPFINSFDLPCLLQDFNPGGPTVSVNLVVRLKSECPNLHYLKLEEPLVGPKVKAIREATNGEVKVLEGWGGLYMMELIPLGICGVMPGLGMVDLMNWVFDRRHRGDSDSAFGLFEKLLPHIVFSLQNLELYLYCDKRLLQKRGLLSDSRRRNASFTPDPATVKYVDELTDRVLGALDQEGSRGVTQEGVSQ